MAHGSHSSHDDKSLELGYQEDNVNITTLIKFLIGLAVFTAISMGLMYGLKIALEAQADAEDKATANPLGYTEKDLAEGKNLPPEPRLQSAPGFGVTLQDGQRIAMDNQLPQAEYWALKKDWQHTLENGMKDAKTGTVIAMPIEEAKKQYLAKNPPVREGATETANEPTASDTSAGRTPGAKPHAMTETPAEGAATEKKETGVPAKPAATPQSSPAATPAAKAAGAH